MTPYVWNLTLLSGIGDILITLHVWCISEKKPKKKNSECVWSVLNSSMFIWRFWCINSSYPGRHAARLADAGLLCPARRDRTEIESFSGDLVLWLWDWAFGLTLKGDRFGVPIWLDSNMRTSDMSHLKVSLIPTWKLRSSEEELPTWKKSVWTVILRCRCYFGQPGRREHEL